MQVVVSGTEHLKDICGEGINFANIESRLT